MEEPGSKFFIDIVTPTAKELGAGSGILGGGSTVDRKDRRGSKISVNQAMREACEAHSHRWPDPENVCFQSF
jgi:hypothetical protein